MAQSKLIRVKARQQLRRQQLWKSSINSGPSICMRLAQYAAVSYTGGNCHCVAPRKASALTIHLSLRSASVPGLGGTERVSRVRPICCRQLAHFLPRPDHGQGRRGCHAQTLPALACHRQAGGEGSSQQQACQGQGRCERQTCLLMH